MIFFTQLFFFVSLQFGGPSLQPVESQAVRGLMSRPTTTWSVPRDRKGGFGTFGRYRTVEEFDGGGPVPPPKGRGSTSEEFDGGGPVPPPRGR